MVSIFVHYFLIIFSELMPASSIFSDLLDDSWSDYFGEIFADRGFGHHIHSSGP